MGGTFRADPRSMSQGWVTAIDAATGAVKWKYRSPRPMVAAVTATACNLLLTGELGGDFPALDARSGHELYHFNTGGSIGGGVVTYAVGGSNTLRSHQEAPEVSGWMNIPARQRS